MMFGEYAGGEPGWWPEGHGSVDALGAAEARLLWSLRRLALMQPLGRARCHAVHIALQQEFGDAGLGIEHLLRCWLVGLSRLAVRRLAIGTPACPLLTADEAGLLRVLRDGDAERLVRLTGSAAAAAMVPLFVAVAGLAKIS